MKIPFQSMVFHAVSLYLSCEGCERDGVNLDDVKTAKQFYHVYSLSHYTYIT